MAGLEGARLGAYELVERVGSGGMAEVYRARQSTAFGREVAVKVIRQGFSEDTMFRERFLREAQAIARLSHPNILPLIEFGEEGDLLYLVMPYAPGGTLRDLIARINGPLPLTDAVEIFTQLCDAVQYAHEQGIVHRDIKPQNVLIQRGKHLLLADFGIARDASSDQKLTMTGAGVGTVEYMAPEQAMGKSDARSDLYSLGIVLYQMLTGRVPFGGSTPFEIMMKQARETLPPARSINPALPREVDGILAMALAKDPGQRFQSVGALLRAAQGLLQPGHGSQTDDDAATRAADPGSQIDLATRAASVRPIPSRSGPPSLPGQPARTSRPDAPPLRQTGPDGGFSPAPSRGTGPGGRYNSSRPAGWAGRPSNAPPPLYNDAYGDDETFATARPPRRPTNPYGGSPSRPGTRPPGTVRPEWAPENTPRRGNKWLLIVAVVFVIAALGVGGLAFAKLSGKNNPPITAATATATAGVTPTATTPPPPKPSYAFMRSYQVFVSVHGAAPQQMTNIPGVGQPSPTVSGFTVTDFLANGTPLLFSPDGRYIAALISLNDAPRDGPINGNLYVIDTQTNAVTTPNSPGSSQLISAYGGGNSLAWVDAHTLLIAGDINNASVLSYDASIGKVSVAFTPAGGALPVGSVVVRGHFAFYSELVPKSGSSSNFVILHQYDLNAHSDKKLFTLGLENPPEGPGPQPNGYAPFDIAPDGAHILWHGTQPGGSSDGIWYGRLNQTGLFQLFAIVNLGPGSSNLLFQPTPLLSPDGKKALLTTSNAVYTINIDGSGLRTYKYPNAQAAWRPDSSGITIAQITNPSSTTATYKTFSCTLSTGGCSAFQNNAGPFYWSPV
jgi:serine/threonine protein kinase